MNLRRLGLSWALLPVTLVACSASGPGDTPGQGGQGNGGSNGGNTSTGGKAPSNGGSSDLGKGGTPGNGGASNGGSATGGASNGGASNGGASNGGASNGGSTNGGSTNGGASTGKGGGASGGATTGSGGVANGGSSTGGASKGGGTSSGGTPGGTSGEDTGTDCTVGELPAASGLTAITKLPDPFTKLDKTRMTTKAEWHCRRQELKKMAEKYAFGTKPLTPKSAVSGTVSATSISVKVTVDGKSGSFTATVKKPTGGTAPYPAIIVYGGGGFGSPLDSGVINSEGVVLISYDPYSVGAEGNGRGANAEKGAYYSVYGGSSATGLLAAWAWGVSRIIDVIEQSDGSVIQPGAIGVTGCSRFGKGSFLAGVLDERVALTMPVESGSAGVPIWRGIPGEGAQSLSSAYGEQPWFGDAFTSFTGSPTKAPLDTHELVAMVAPRGLFIMDNPHIANLGPKSAHVAALGGAEVYKALGVGDAITYYSDVTEGGHCSLRPEWATPLKNNIQRFLKKTGTAAGVIKAHSKATGNLADWRDWTTPTLQ